jgi:uncharacterized protein
MFAAFTLSIVPGFELIFGASTGVNFGKVLSVLPLAMVASFLNAPKEELWFRGLFLTRYAPLLGKKMSNLLQSAVFVLAHFTPQYMSAGPLFFPSFLALVFVLGLIWGYIMQMTGSILCSTLSHVGADVWIFVPLLLITS